MEQLKILYKELQERQQHLEQRKQTPITQGRISENLLTMIRVQQLLLPLVINSQCRCKGKTGSYIDYSKDKEMCKDCDRPK